MSVASTIRAEWKSSRAWESITRSSPTEKTIATRLFAFEHARVQSTMPRVRQRARAEKSGFAACTVPPGEEMCAAPRACRNSACDPVDHCEQLEDRRNGELAADARHGARGRGSFGESLRGVWESRPRAAPALRRTRVGVAVSVRIRCRAALSRGPAAQVPESPGTSLRALHRRARQSTARRCPPQRAATARMRGCRGRAARARPASAGGQVRIHQGANRADGAAARARRARGRANDPPMGTHRVGPVDRRRRARARPGDTESMFPREAHVQAATNVAPRAARQARGDPIRHADRRRRTRWRGHRPQARRRRLKPPRTAPRTAGARQLRRALSVAHRRAAPS